MLVSLNEVVAIAEEKGTAIGAFNTPNLEALRAVIDSAEELGVPVIVQHCQMHEELIPLDIIGPIMIDHARKASVPVCVHLDHGEDLAYLERALEHGFTSVMYDGSVNSYEENLAVTREAVALAKKYHANVEAELGSMGKREFGSGKPGEEDAEKIYTDPDKAKEFVENTGIDALACSFGTTHGIYLTEPKLNFDIVSGVRRKTNGIPVVMHGGSGVSKEDFHKAIKAGVRKINYFTYMDKAGGTTADSYIRSIEEGKPVFFSEVRKAAMAAMKANVTEAMKVFSMLE
ncbi:MAG: class II fructose-bisphosphate aldolase [Eubacteriales bacterium]|nr:class II fructose-bisphosphate aldolase [Eubacteriales bacterium]